MGRAPPASLPADPRILQEHSPEDDAKVPLETPLPGAGVATRDSCCPNLGRPLPSLASVAPLTIRTLARPRRHKVAEGPDGGITTDNIGRCEEPAGRKLDPTGRNGGQTQLNASPRPVKSSQLKSIEVKSSQDK